MTVDYQDELGWARIDDVLSPERARSVAEACFAVLDGPEDGHRPNDKPSGGTRRLTEVLDRIPEAAGLTETIDRVVATILDRPYVMSVAAFRSPGPGYGRQKLHADTLARLADGPYDCATAIIPLVDFTEENGATRLVPGSHHRFDLQRQAGNLDRHPDEIRLTGPAGCCFVFCGHVLHGGAENRSSEPRPAIQLVFRTEGSMPGAGR